MSFAIALSGCTSTKLVAEPPKIASPSEALIVPPTGGPAMLGIIEQVYTNARKQDISLATEASAPGQNIISISMYQAGRQAADATGILPDAPVIGVNMALEAQTALPGAAMEISPFFAQNAYGPFGYATGYGRAGDTCIYAWQRIEPRSNASTGLKRGPISIRLQLCDSNKSEQALLGVMYKLRINSQVYEPMKAPALIGQIGASVVPTGADGFATTLDPVVETPAPRRPRAAPVAAVVETRLPVALPQPAPGDPIVPGPSGVVSSRAVLNPSVQSPATGTPQVPLASQSVLVPPPPACLTASPNGTACR